MDVLSLSSSSSSSQSPEGPEPLQSSASLATEETNNGVHDGAAILAGSFSDDSNPTVGDPPPRAAGTKEEKNPENLFNKSKKKMKKKVPRDTSASQSASFSSSPSLSPSQKGTRVACKRRNTRPVFAAVRRNHISDTVSFRLGMSIAAFVSQILERKDTPSERMSAHHLAVPLLGYELYFNWIDEITVTSRGRRSSLPLTICSSAVRESLANDFGDTFDSFVRNFEKSFRSTLSTLKLIKESSVNKENNHIGHLNLEDSAPDMAHNAVDFACRGGDTSSSVEGCHTEELFRTSATGYQLNHNTAMEENEVTDTINLELALHGQTNQLGCVSQSPILSMTNQSMLSTIEKSLMEQTRSNDLKNLELSLSMRKLKLKETQLALNYDSNNLERSKLAMGISKASFKAEKFKTQLEDVRHAELLRKCIDCLVAGLFIMVASLSYGAYVYSYQKVTEVTASCKPSPKESKSWWMPNTMSSINSGMQLLSCQFQVLVRMVFGFIMIVTIAYLLLKRSASSKQTMPVTFIVLLLGCACGFAGKICIDSLGGSGYHWLLHWETICFVHFFCNVCTSTLFFLLYGPVNVSQGTKGNAIIPYWTRRFMFYVILLLFLPLLCGLLPFASPGEWKDHFLSRITDYIED